MRRRSVISSVAVVLAMALAGPPAVPAVAAATSGGLGTGVPSPVGKPWRAPVAPQPKNPLLPQLSTPGTVAGVRAIGIAAGQARRLGRPVLVGALTTGTTQVWARPGGELAVRERVLPVRVRSGRGWVPVSTRLIADQHGGWRPAAVPGDSVRLSAGGSAPLAVLSGGGQSLRLRWPGPLPRPAVAGSSATYRNVLPGVDLVLTATSVQAGGFSEVLVVRNAAAARDPRLASLTLGVSVSAGRLAATAGGGLAAVLPGTDGAFVAPAPTMWDSTVRPANSAVPSRDAIASAAALGATVAPIWSGPASSPAGPGGGARVAPVGVALSGRGTLLRLLPDRTLLASQATRYPVFIDPSFSWYPKTGNEQAYDPVQSDAGNSGIFGDTTNCTGSHYNSSGYKFSPMGYDDFEAGPCQYKDTDRALYRIGIPSAVVASNAHLHSADVQLTEVYTSSCSANPSVTVSWIGAISSGTGWGGPGKTSNNVDSSHSFGPDSGSCNSTENTGNRVSQGFSIMSDMSSIGSASNITIRVAEPGSINDADHKQLTDNPTIQFTYNDTPNVPSSLEEAASSSGSGSLACDSNATDPNLPIVGKTDSTNGVYLLATYKDPDGDTVAGTAKYWNNATPSTTFSISAGSSLSGTGAAQIPASFTSGMPNGTVIGWQAQASDGTFTSSWSGKCYFAVYPTDPDPPTVTAGFDQTKNQATGAPLSFTITQSSTAAKEFVWGLDKTPPTTGTIPSNQICSSTSTTCTLSSGKAVLTITAPSPGPHILWVFEQDAAGNDSGMATGALAGMVETFDVANDPAVSYTGGSSLAANFAAALGASRSYDNTMVSSSSGTSCGTATGDGTGTDFVAGDLTGAGWVASKTVTVNGTSFTLPAFGSCGADNLLAANQTIGAGSSGAQGTSLVFLATSSDGFATVPGLVTGSVDSIASDTTAPAVMGGTPVTGTGCTGAIANDTTLQGMCVPASGVISYVSAPNCPAAQSYDLTVPDWWSGPSDTAALTMPGVVESGGAHAQTVKLYAFSVPLIASCTVASVTLPDVGGTARAVVTSGSGGVQQAMPALHIFGVSVRNTTTATPQADGTTPAAPSGQAWTGAFQAPVENAFFPPSGVTWGNQTIRLWAAPDLTAAQGAEVRIRLSFPGFLSADGTGPLQIGAATIARQFYGAAPAQKPVPLTFGGLTSVTVPEGGDIYSDPLPLADLGTNQLTFGHGMLISLYVKNPSLPLLPMDSESSGAGAWFAPSSTPDETTDQTGTPFTGTGSSEIGASPILAGYDVTTPAASVQGTASPGAPTVVVTGSNLVDGWTSSAPGDSLNQPGERLPGQLSSQPAAAGFGVTDGGVEANQVLADSSLTGGVSLLARIDRDVLAEPDVGTVVIDQGLEDLLAQAGSTTSGPNLNNALAALVNQLNANGINVIVATLTPCAGFSDTSAGHTCTTGTGATVDAARGYVNSVTSGISVPNCWADFDATVGNGASPEALVTSPTNYDSGDHANESYAGFAALAQAVTSTGGFCALMPSMFPLPAVP